MRIHRLTVRNILGIDQFDYEAGRFNLIEGANATGKTSIIQSLKTLVDGGHDATLLRRGEQQGEIVLILEDDQGEQLIARKVITEDHSDFTMQVPDGAKIPQPRSFLTKLIDSMSANPVEFLTAPAKKRAELLLEALPLSVTPKQVLDACGVEITKEEAKGHALDVVDMVAKRLYDERTGINRAAKEKKGTAEQLDASLPPEPEGDVDEALRAVRQRQHALQLENSARRQKLANAREQAREHARAVCDDYIGRARAVFEKAKAEAEALRDQSFQIADGAHANGLTTLQAETGPKLEELAGQEASLLEAAKAQKAYEMARQFRSEVETLEQHSEDLTAALDNLEALKSELLAKLPIKGLEVKDRQIFYQSIPLDRVNRARQIEIAVAVARLRSGKLGIVNIDGLECLDSTTFKAFEAAALKSGLQFFVTKVSDGALHFEASK